MKKMQFLFFFFLKTMLGKFLEFGCMQQNIIIIFWNISEKIGYFNTEFVFYSVNIQPMLCKIGRKIFEKTIIFWNDFFLKIFEFFLNIYSTAWTVDVNYNSRPLFTQWTETVKKKGKGKEGGQPGVVVVWPRMTVCCQWLQRWSWWQVAEQDEKSRRKSTGGEGPAVAVAILPLVWI